MTSTVVGLFDDMYHAQSAVADLQSEGVLQSDISLIANESVTEPASTTVVVEHESAAMTGVGTGAVFGGAAGLALGLAAVAVPGVGPVFAAGPIFAALSGALLGAATGGLIGALVDVGVPEVEATYYAEGVRRGGIVVTAHVAPSFAPRAAQIMQADGAVDIHNRVSFWRETGWTAYDPKAPVFTREEIARERAAWAARPTAQTTSTATAAEAEAAARRAA